MTRAEQAREEEHFRKVEGAMLHVEDAGRRLAEAATELKKDGAEPHLVAALETAAGAVRADHSRLMTSLRTASSTCFGSSSMHEPLVSISVTH